MSGPAHTEGRSHISPGPAIAVALTFVWLGMVFAISFLEAPLKFRAPGVTLQIGLGIGRLVFRALNTAEVTLAVVVLIALVPSRPPGGTVAGTGDRFRRVAVQLLVVRSRLTRRSDAVLTGHGSAHRSRGHYAYVALEAIKVIALAVSGILLLAG